MSHGIVVIPFRTEDVQPSKAMELFLGAKHWLDAMSAPMDTHFGKLADQLQFLTRQDDSASDSMPPKTVAQPAVVQRAVPGYRLSRRFVMISTALVLTLFLTAAAVAMMIWRAMSSGRG